MPPRKRSQAASGMRKAAAAVNAYYRECEAEAKRRGKALFKLHLEVYALARGQTLEDCRSLEVAYAPHAAKEEYRSVLAELRAVGFEDLGETVAAPLRFSRFIHIENSHEGLDILEKHVGRINTALKAEKWGDALCIALGTTVAAREEDFWFRKCYEEGRIRALYKGLDRCWKALFKRSDAELGIDADARAPIECFLGGLQDAVEMGTM